MPLPEQAPAARPTSGIHRDVVALVGGAGALRAGTVVAAGEQAGNGAGLLVRENARAIDDARLLRRAERHFDHVDAEERGVRVLLRIAARAVDQLLQPERTPPVPEP